MKPPPFDYVDPRTIEEVLAVLSQEGDDAAVLAGGQSLVPLLNLRLARPATVVDVNEIAELAGIQVSADSCRIGAIVRMARVKSDAGLAAALPVLGLAAGFVAHPQIRSRSTAGGSLCHADPSAELPTVAVALGARMHLRSATGERAVAAEDFFRGMFDTAKRPDELLVAVEFPLRAGWLWAYDEVTRRQGDFPFVGLCLGVRVEGGTVVEARAAAGGVEGRPVRLDRLEAALVGRRVAAGVPDAAAAGSAQVDPVTDLHGTGAMRRGMLRTLTRRLGAQLDAKAA
jgi:carbon-monoxide dehydrogenase medium subunit